MLSRRPQSVRSTMSGLRQTIEEKIVKILQLERAVLELGVKLEAEKEKSSLLWETLRLVCAQKE